VPEWPDRFASNSPAPVYHVTSRGNRREPIFVDDEDRHALLEIVAQALSRFDAQALA
jgi:putative transposase